jgi:beta-N-acetylhexosaminidase
MTIMGQATAAEARYAGLHWTFSPVVDLNYNFNNPITNICALSYQPERVIRLATAYVRGLQAEGQLAATAKHFPGDGIDDRYQHLSITCAMYQIRTGCLSLPRNAQRFRATDPGG